MCTVQQICEPTDNNMLLDDVISGQLLTVPRPTSKETPSSGRCLLLTGDLVGKRDVINYGQPQIILCPTIRTAGKVSSGLVLWFRF